MLGFTLSCGCTRLWGQCRILERAADGVSASDGRQVSLEPKAVQDVGQRAERDAGVPTLDGAERWSRHACPLGDQ